MGTWRERVCLLALLWIPAMGAADPPLQPVTVCEVLKDAANYDGKVLAVMGRLSSRQAGVTLNEESCGEEKVKALSLAVDGNTAPKPPLVLEIDTGVVSKKLKSIKQRTTLHEFRFGSSDYDRWAIIYGRVEVPKHPPEKPAAIPARLLYRGDGVIVFLRGDE